MRSLGLTRLAVSTPLGLTTRATQVAFAAGLTSFRRIDPLGGENPTVRASRYPVIPPGDPGLEREERMLFFARRALSECLRDWSTELGPLTCYLALPEPDGGAPLQLEHIRSGLRAAAPAHVQIDWSLRPVCEGRAGWFELARSAWSDLASGAVRTALLGGLDTACDQASLRGLGRRRMLLGADNLDGRIPGEGAGFVCLSTSALHPLAQLAALACRRDVLPFDRRNPLHAIALSAVLQELQRSSADGPRPNQLISCQPQEASWGRELSHAYLRAVPLMPEPYRASHVASGLGDLGAAAPFVGLAAALHWMQHAKRLGRSVQRVVLLGAADQGAVGGAVLDAPAGS